MIGVGEAEGVLLSTALADRVAEVDGVSLDVEVPVGFVEGEGEACVVLVLECVKVGSAVMERLGERLLVSEGVGEREI